MANTPRMKKSPEERAAAPRRARKAAGAEAAADGAVAATTTPKDTASGPVLRKKELMDRVQTLSKAKKTDVKTIVDATLAVIGEALAKGEELNLPPLGKAKVNRQKGTKMGEMFIIKLRRGGAKAETEEEPLAADAE